MQRAKDGELRLKTNETLLSGIHAFQIVGSIMTWHPVSFREIIEEIESSFQRMNANQRLLWERIRVPPVKWKEVNYGGPGDGFWVVAVFEHWVIWYNDIEEGFNVSEFREHGTIAEYYAQQDSLEEALNRLHKS